MSLDDYGTPACESTDSAAGQQQQIPHPPVKATLETLELLPWGQRFELTDMGNVHVAYRTGRGHALGLTDGSPGRIPRGGVFIQDGIPRKLTDGELTSCPACFTFPCSCAESAE